jgi:hypothetical protein
MGRGLQARGPLDVGDITASIPPTARVLLGEDPFDILESCDKENQQPHKPKMPPTADPMEGVERVERSLRQEALAASILGPYLRHLDQFIDQFTLFEGCHCLPIVVIFLLQFSHLHHVLPRTSLKRRVTKAIRTEEEVHPHNS